MRGKLKWNETVDGTAPTDRPTNSLRLVRLSIRMNGWINGGDSSHDHHHTEAAEAVVEIRETRDAPVGGAFRLSAKRWNLLFHYSSGRPGERFAATGKDA